MSSVPETGETSTTLWLAVVLLAGMALVVLNTGKRREEI